MRSTKWRKLQTPAVEHIGVKLGEVGISLKSLRHIAAGPLCPIYNESTFKAFNEEDQKDILQWGLPEHFFDSDEMITVAMEARGAFPATDLFRELGATLAHRTVSTVLVSVGQTFQMYEEANWVHCDRSTDHILFRKSTLNRDMPGVLAIDHDHTMSLANKSFETTNVGRQHMLEWFAIIVHNTCHQDKEKRLPEPFSSCDPMNPARFRDLQIKTATAAYQQLEAVIELEESDTDCKGSRFLANEVVGPALLCAASGQNCDVSTAPLIAKLQDWAVTYYGQPFQKQSALGPELFNQE